MSDRELRQCLSEYREAITLGEQIARALRSLDKPPGAGKESGAQPDPAVVVDLTTRRGEIILSAGNRLQAWMTAVGAEPATADDAGRRQVSRLISAVMQQTQVLTRLAEDLAGATRGEVTDMLRTRQNLGVYQSRQSSPPEASYLDRRR